MTRVDAQYAECNQPVYTKKKFINLREVSARLVLPPGEYVVIPATFNRGEQGRLLVRLFTEQHWADSRPVERQRSREDKHCGVINYNINIYNKY